VLIRNSPLDDGLQAELQSFTKNFIFTQNDVTPEPPLGEKTISAGQINGKALTISTL
jgi:hypothetical protein